MFLHKSRESLGRLRLGAEKESRVLACAKGAAVRWVALWFGSGSGSGRRAKGLAGVEGVNTGTGLGFVESTL